MVIRYAIMRTDVACVMIEILAVDLVINVVNTVRNACRLWD